MSSGRMEVRIVTRKLPDGRTEVFMFDPVHGREARSGIKVSGEEEVVRLRENIEAKGFRVSHKEIS